MDIMDIQAVESKLSDVTVTPIPRSQVQNFYNYQQQREQREQQPQIQISAIHHAPRDRSGGASTSSAASSVLDLHFGGSGGIGNNTSIAISSGRDLTSKRERDYHNQSSTNISAAAAVAALQYSQQLHAQWAMLQQQSNNNAATAFQQRAMSSNSGGGGNSSSNGSNNANSHKTNNSATNIGASGNGSNSVAVGGALGGGNGGTLGAMGLGTNATAILSAAQSQLKYPQSTSPIIVTTQQSANITTPMTSVGNMPTVGAASNPNGLTKYAQLLAVIEEMGRDIRPTYTGSRSSTERLKRGINNARSLVRECLVETERSARQ